MLLWSASVVVGAFGSKHLFWLMNSEWKGTSKYVLLLLHWHEISAETSSRFGRHDQRSIIWSNIVQMIVTKGIKEMARFLELVTKKQHAEFSSRTDHKSSVFAFEQANLSCGHQLQVLWLNIHKVTLQQSSYWASSWFIPSWGTFCCAEICRKSAVILQKSRKNLCWKCVGNMEQTSQFFGDKCWEVWGWHSEETSIDFCRPFYGYMYHIALNFQQDCCPTSRILSNISARWLFGQNSENLGTFSGITATLGMFPRK